MIEQLDQKDKLILYLLDNNSKQALTKIAKETRLSRESVLYRINQYLKKGIIKGYLPIVNTGLLGFTHYKVFIKLSNISNEKENQFINLLKNHPKVSWVGLVDGTYSIKYVVRAKSTQELSQTLDEINKDYWKYIKKQDSTTIISGHHYPRDYLIKEFDKTKIKTERKDEIKWTEATNLNSLDKVDYQILEQLCQNLRKTSTEIASVVKTSPDTVLQRIKKMEKMGLIQHYTIWPNVNKLVGQYYKILLTFNVADKELEERLLKYCNAEPNIVYLVKTFGNWQYEIDIEVESPEQMRELMRKLSTAFADKLSEYNALNIYEEHKFKMFDVRAIGNV